MDSKYSADYNIISSAITEVKKSEALKVYESMVKARKFEDYIVKVGSGGRFKIKVHMSSGQEGVAAALSVAASEYQYFIQHRSMDLYIALTNHPELVRDEITCTDAGCCGGQLGGGFQYHKDGIDIYTHTGFIGENVSVGVGAALGNGRKTVCFFGDGAAEEDYVLQAYGFAATHKLPVLFMCTDNELSVLSPVSKRRSWALADVAKGFGLQTVDITDDPFSLIHCIRGCEATLPALINVRVCRNYWHAGLGVDAPPRWDRLSIVQQQLIDMGMGKEIKAIEDAADKQMEEVWKAFL